MSTNPFRLPDNAVPMHYWLDLGVNFSDFTTIGTVVIAVQIKKPTDTIVLNSADIVLLGAPTLEILTPAVDEDKSKITALNHNFDEKHEMLTIKFGQQILPGLVNLRINFRGQINDKLNGFYRTWYLTAEDQEAAKKLDLVTEEGQRQFEQLKRWGGATQFEATDARRAFPCFDEPAMKATFDITIYAPEHMTVLSNMPVRETEVNKDMGRKKTVFKTTSTMSTYLVAWVIAELEYVEGVASDSTPNATPIRVYTVPGKKEHGRFALETGVEVLKYFESWFGIPYALPKLDMVAMPDFAAGAMENWGLVTYRETALLLNPASPTAAVKQRIADVVAHELAHQWFGNFTTMEWWTHLWLNEGFATYMGTKAVNHLYPEWDYPTGYVAEDYLAALSEDSLLNTHPIEVDVVNPGEISEVFDAISYLKGCVVNFMLENYLGEELFRNGLNKYLDKHKFGNASTDDLWRVLEDVSKKPVLGFMSSYTRQPGYPVIYVGTEGDKLWMIQERFLADGSDDKENLSWNIPVGIEVQYGGDKKGFVMIQHYLDKPYTDLTHPEIQSAKWIKLNPEQKGFYRVCYSPTMLTKLAQAVRNRELSVVDRLCLLSDTLAMAKAGHTETSRVLDLLDAYKGEESYYVLSVVAGVFSALENLLPEGRTKEDLKQMARNFFEPLVNKVGWVEKPDESHIDILLRSLVLGTYGEFDGRDVDIEAHVLFNYHYGSEEMNPNIRGVVYGLAARNGDRQTYDDFLKIYRSTDSPEVKVRILRALGKFKDQDILKDALAFAMSVNEVRPQDAFIILMNAAGAGGENRKQVWEFFKSNWEEFKKRYNSGGLKLISRFVELPASFATREDLEDVRNFYQGRELENIKRTIKQVIESIENRVKWVERDLADITEWFESRGQKTVAEKCAEDDCALDTR